MKTPEAKAVGVEVPGNGRDAPHRRVPPHNDCIQTITKVSVRASIAETNLEPAREREALVGHFPISLNEEFESRSAVASELVLMRL